jgi:hypothetical protein
LQQGIAALQCNYFFKTANGALKLGRVALSAPVLGNPHFFKAL